jgi:hypothetical protein
MLLAALSASAFLAAQSPQPGAHPIPIDAGWPCHAHDAQHSGRVDIPTQNLGQILWSTPVDLQPQYSGTILFSHYSGPLITPRGTIVVPVKTGATGGFRLEGHRKTTGAQFWQLVTDYVQPPHNWTMPLGAALVRSLGVVVPAAGGTVLLRMDPDATSGAVQRLCFYGLSNYLGAQAGYDANVMISTPIAVGGNGVLYFGFDVQGATPLNLESGLARYDTRTGAGTWVAAHTAASDPAIQKPSYNCAPALSADGTSLYVTVSDQAGYGFSHGYLLKLDSTTLALQARVRLLDSWSGLDAWLADDGTATPAIGPDGDVYMGVIENPFPLNNDRGWMLHYDANLSQVKLPGAFGWDNTASMLPSSCVASYSGSSPYLVLTKYNNYAGIGSGNGLNKVAVLDPATAMIDPISGVSVMAEVITVLSPTPDPGHPGGFKEWCINSVAVDTVRRCAMVNNEDGKLYRWDFATNTLSQTITLTAGLFEAYTPTAIGPDGVVYAINDATLFAVGN